MFLVVFKSSNPRSFPKLKLKLVGDPLEWDSWDAYSQSAEIILQIKTIQDFLIFKVKLFREKEGKRERK